MSLISGIRKDSTEKVHHMDNSFCAHHHILKALALSTKALRGGGGGRGQEREPSTPPGGQNNVLTGFY